MPRRERHGPEALSELTPTELALLWGEPPPMETLADRWEAFALLSWRPGRVMADDSRSPRDLWDLLGEQLLAKWIEERPGTRPAMWWRFVAPTIAREAWMPIPDSSGYADHVPSDQLDYLRRHDLLTPGERAALAVQQVTLPAEDRP